MKILHVMAGAPEGGAETFFLEGALALADGCGGPRARGQCGARRHRPLRPDRGGRHEKLYGKIHQSGVHSRIAGLL